MSQSSQVFFQLGPRPAAPRNNTLIITPYPTTPDGYQRNEIKHGAATFVLDPIPNSNPTVPETRNHVITNGNGNGGQGHLVIGNPHLTNGGPQVNIINNDVRPQQNVVCLNDDVIPTAHAQSELRDGLLLPVPVARQPQKPEVSSVDIMLGPRGSNQVDIQPEGLGVLRTEAKVKESCINISFSGNKTNNKPWISPKPRLLSVEAIPPQPVTSTQGVTLERGIRNQSTGINVKVGRSLTLAPPSDGQMNRSSSPISFPVQGGSREVRGHLALFPPPHTPPPKPPQLGDNEAHKTLLGDNGGHLRLPTVIAGSHHFRFSPSLTRRPCRLQTVLEVTPSNGQNGNYSEEGEEEEEGVGVLDRKQTGVPNPEDTSELFTSVVNFRLDREAGDSAPPALVGETRVGVADGCGGQPQDRGEDRGEDRGGSQIPYSSNSHSPRSTAGRRSSPGRSQESNVLLTELDLGIREELPRVPTPEPYYLAPYPKTSPVENCQEAPGSNSRPSSAIIDCDNPYNRSPSPKQLEPLPIEYLPDIYDIYDPRRRASYRISAISDDGIRAWTQSSRDRQTEIDKALVNGAINGEDETPYMDKLKNVAARLKLATRRASTQAWRERVVGKPAGVWRSGQGLAEKKKSSLHDFGDVQDESEESQWCEDRLDRVNEALSWLRRELLYMKEQDQTLARCLITLRHDIQTVKLARSSAEHKEAIEDAADVLEEARHLAGHSDTPPEHFSTPLKQFGVTRMNINSRRFSVF